MTEPTIWDIAAARERRDEALSNVEVKSAPWAAVAMDALRAVAARHAIVTSDDVWQELDRMGIGRPIEGRAMGPVMRRAVREGLLTPSGYARGTNPAHHADVARTYTSRIAA